MKNEKRDKKRYIIRRKRQSEEHGENEEGDE